jgi:hypothetical protein
VLVLPRLAGHDLGQLETLLTEKVTPDGRGPSNDRLGIAANRPGASDSHDEAVCVRR